MPSLFDIRNIFPQSGRSNNDLMRTMPIAIYTTNRSGIISFFNNKARELWGREPKLNDPSEIKYCGSWKLYEPDGSPMPHDGCPMAKALQQEKSIKGEEICIERPDGSRVFAMANIDLIYDENHTLMGAINILNDITERKRAERDTYWLAAIVESSHDAIISKNLEGIITSWNAGAEKMFGYKPEEVLGKSINLLISASHQNEEVEILSKIRTGKKVDHFETIRLAKSGKKIHVSLTISPIRNSKNEVIGASKIARDITKQVKLTKQLKKYNKQLKELNNIKDDFIGLASHELKTPLTIIKAHLQLLGLADLPEDSQLIVDKTLHHTDKLNELVSSLLDISRIKEGKLELNYSTFDLCELIRDCINSIRLTETDFAFVEEGFSNELIVCADRQRIEQVVFNLLTNAVKYSRSAKRVKVRIEREQSNVVVSIIDFGIGIPSHHLEKIFTRFFRVDDTSAAKFSGLGIGLYVSKEIVDRHKGEIWAESENGKGAKFSFRLPLDGSIDGR